LQSARQQLSDQRSVRTSCTSRSSWSRKPVQVCNVDVVRDFPDVVVSVDARRASVASRVISVDPSGKWG